VYTEFWWGNLRDSPLGRPRRRREDYINMDFQEGDVDVWTASSWPTIETAGGIF